MKLKASNSKHFQQSAYKKGSYKCHLCGSKNRMKCAITQDGGLAYCSNTFSDAQDSKDRYLHVLNSNSIISSESQSKMRETVQTSKASVTLIHEVYSALLEELTLEERHSNNLINERGLGDNLLASNLYASVPSFEERERIVKALSEKYNLTGVPGFYTKNGAWNLHMNLPGFYIPYRTEHGQIVGLQIRLDEPVDNKYTWLSSDGKENGVSSGAPLHFVNPDIVSQTKTVYLTEGALKADLLGSRLHKGVIASAGVCVLSPDRLSDSIVEVFPKIERIIVAYDMDWETNENVKAALTRLLSGFVKLSNIQIDVAIWNSELGKGIDDLVIREEFVEEDINFITLPLFASSYLGIELLNDINGGDKGEIAEDSLSEEKEGNFDLMDEPTERLGLRWREFSKTGFPNANR